jgi:cell division protein DivIC
MDCVAKLEKPATAAVFAVLLLLFVVLLAPRMLQVQKLKERSAGLEQELRELKKKNNALEQELRLLRDDPVYLEKVARSQFNKAKEGEIVYKVVRE